MVLCSIYSCSIYSNIDDYGSIYTCSIWFMSGIDGFESSFRGYSAGLLMEYGVLRAISLPMVALKRGEVVPEAISLHGTTLI